MEINMGDYLISDDKNLIQPNRVYELLSDTYWASKRSKDTMQTAMESSLCFGVYKDGIQIGFARCVTDYAIIYYLADVIIDERYRGQGLGKALVKAITEHETLSHLRGILDTRDAHGLYERFGFFVAGEYTMLKPGNSYENK